MTTNSGVSLRTGAAFVRSEFFNATIFRASFWLRFVYTFLMMYSVGYVWRALYATGSGKLDWTLSQIITYGILGVALEAILHPGNGPQHYIMEQVRQGTIEMDIMKPLDFEFHMFAKNTGALMVKLALRVLPSLVAAYFLFGFTVPSAGLMLAFLVSLALSLMVSFLLNFIIGLISMITMNIRNINWGYNAMLRFFSGQMVPLWLFPSALGVLGAVLPFRCIYSIPMSIYIGSFSGIAISGQLGIQAAWVILLLVLSRLMMRRVLTRLMIQGG